jgi:hypothetical protein
LTTIGKREKQKWAMLIACEEDKNIMAGRGARPFGERRNWNRVFSGVT